MSKRYGIIVKQDDGTEVVSNILEKEGGPPVPGSTNAEVVADLDPGVKIGMIRGGKGEAVAGFGFEGPATPPVRGTTDEEKAEAKIAASEARLQEAKGDDNYERRLSEDTARRKAEADEAKTTKKSASK